MSGFSFRGLMLFFFINFSLAWSSKYHTRRWSKYATAFSIQEDKRLFSLVYQFVISGLIFVYSYLAILTKCSICIRILTDGLGFACFQQWVSHHTVVSISGSSLFYGEFSLHGLQQWTPPQLWWHSLVQDVVDLI